MDFYQIWTTYNRQWSKFEISVFVGAMTLVCIVIAVCVHKKKFSLIQGGGNIGVAVVPWDCVWFNDIYQDGNYSSV